MRPIARQSARLAKHTRVVRQSSLPPHARAFHSNTADRSDNRDPNNHPDHSRRTEQRAEEQRLRDNASATKTGQDGEGSKTQTTDESKPLVLRKTLRRQRGQDQIPEPPAIPDWFLKYNVSLHADSVRPNTAAKSAQVLRCIDNDTGHTLFEVPFYEAWATPTSHRYPEGEDQRKDSKDERVKSEDPEEEREKSSEESPKEPVKAPESSEKEPEKARLDKSFFNSKVGISASSTSPSKSPAQAIEQVRAHMREASKLLKDTKAEMIARRKREVPGNNANETQDTETTLPSEHAHSLLRWILLEVETNIRAGFIAATHAQQSLSHAASRLDISLHCPDSECHDQMDTLVEDLATITQADVIRLDANDFADLTHDYVGLGNDLPGGFSTLAHDVYEGYASTAILDQTGAGSKHPEEAEEEYDEDEDEEESDENKQSGFTPSPLGGLRKALFDRRHELSKALGAIGVTGAITITAMPPGARSTAPASMLKSSSVFQPASTSASRPKWDDARLSALLDSILDAPKQKRAQDTLSEQEGLGSRIPQNMVSRSETSTTRDTMWRPWSHSGFWMPDVAKHLTAELRDSEASNLRFEPISKISGSPALNSDPTSRRTIIHVRDLKDISMTNIGSAIMERLTSVVQKRRRAGEEIVIVGTTAQDGFPVEVPDYGDLPFKTVLIPPVFDLTDQEHAQLRSTIAGPIDIADAESKRIMEINLRNIQSLSRRLRPQESLDLFHKDSLAQMRLNSLKTLWSTVLTLGQVQGIVLTAIGLSKSHTPSEDVKPIHIGLAALIASKTDKAIRAWVEFKQRSETKESKAGTGERTPDEAAKARIERIKKSCNTHESRLLTGVVDPQNIKTGFNEVHAPQETIEALKTLTSLSLLRPDAFKYGVLAQDRLPGLMLYGPPGTGKTLLAKAVAKEAQATVLEISGAQIYEKYVGEGEKMVRAVFSLAKKLSPCIVFIDEADAIFGSRSGAGNRNTHREIINQFLREWDGMELHNVFIMVASNRPFDLDDAVLRRLPRRILVDLPVAKDRESILNIHLKDEVLDSSVSLPSLAEQTPLYSGSDLKNLCVAAALACVREEMELANAVTASGEQEDSKAEKGKEESNPKFPDKRTLTSTHFEKAIKEISASISEDMSSLTAIRKFDEQYGDRRGRRKKAGYGFGMGEAGIDENSIRVRPGASSAPPS